MTAFFDASLFLFGLLFGSFANVVIWRFPRGESVAFPGSHCPRCEGAIAWYDNIPVISWLVLRAKCRSCSAPISVRYPTVELLSGLLWLLAAVLWGVSVRTVFGVLFFYLLLILSFIDVDTLRLPNRLVAIVGAVGVLGVLAGIATGEQVVPLLGTLRSGWPSLITALGGAAIAAAIALALALGYRAARKREGFGMGDVKLLAVLGIFLGWYALLTLFLGSLLGAAYGIVAASAKRLSLSSRFPFGPFLAIGAVLTCVFGQQLVHWYVALVT